MRDDPRPCLNMTAKLNLKSQTPIFPPRLDDVILPLVLLGLQKFVHQSLMSCSQHVVKVQG